ncbi:MAG TPA: RiPP maturation radical SAM C-methyltransferase [Candidatus Baltobacteraceae bacterium]|nr:RiPP maturation radical SAM C-methyltransferase [Candidatus Baltobacteraceae bacterium]
MKRHSVLLVSQPWAFVHVPSIQLGVLLSSLRRAGIDATAASLYLDFMHLLKAKSRDSADASGRFTVDSYTSISNLSFLTGIAEWAFAFPPIAVHTEEEDEAFLRCAERRCGPRVIATARMARAHAEEFLCGAVQNVIDSGCTILGISSCYSQTAASLQLAMRVKQIKPEVVIVMGGASCEADMGAALHESYTYLDYVLRGEAEDTLPQLVRAIEGQSGFEEIAGLCYRAADGSTKCVGDGATMTSKMDDVPIPEYDEYFEHLKRTNFAADVNSYVMIPVESSRGCWWGAKNHCKFCGINGGSMAYRSKSPERFVSEVEGLCVKHRNLLFQATDSILDLRYFESVFPRFRDMRERGIDLYFFYETKANLRKQQVALLREAGVQVMQPGLESLSTNVLRLMNKGVTALQNIRLLKWAMEYEIDVEWNIICGFPGETAADYAIMTELIPMLTHLHPPDVIQMQLQRFSPYFEKADENGVRILGPASWYKFVFQKDDQTVWRLAYNFEHECESAVATDEVRALKELVKRNWDKRTYRKGQSTLAYWRGPGFLTLRDRRLGLPAQDLRIAGLAASVYTLCDEILTPSMVVDSLGKATIVEVQQILSFFVKKKLMVEENGQYLALATAYRAAPVAASA